MRTRTSIVIIFVIICILTIGFGVYLTIASTASVNNPPGAVTPTPVVTVTPLPTSLPAPVQKFSDAVNTISGLSFTLLTYVATVLISVLVLLLLLRIWTLSGKSNLVIDTFTNATGDDSIGKELGGLNQLTREFLADELAQVQLLVNKYNDQGLNHFTGCPPPETADDVQLTSVLKSLTAASTGEAQTAVQLLSVVLTPRGTKVITTLHSLSRLPVTFGLSFELMDLKGKREPASVTFWEPAHAAASSTHNQATSVNVEASQAHPVQSTQIDPAALASYNLGHIYEMRGALDEAIQQYEAALNKQPDYEEASTALIRVLQNRRTSDQRFLTLLQPAVRWLAIEIALRSMEEQSQSWNSFFHRKNRQKNEWRANSQAKLYNYFGYFHQVSAPMFSSSAQFYNRAITFFTRASQLDKKWFLPPMNLGVTHLLIARQKVGRQMPLQLSRKGITEIYLALPYFAEAQHLFDEYKKGQPISRTKLSETERMITLYLAIAQLLSRDPSLIQHAQTAVATMRNSGWDLDSETNSYMLYNLACWYGIADNMSSGVAQAKQEARSIITMCIAREPDFLFRAYQEPDLKSISDEKGWQNLYHILRQYRNQVPQLAELQGPDFVNIINSILQQVQWL